MPIKNKIFSILIPVVVFSLGILNLGRDLFGIGHSQAHYAGDLVDTRFNNLILEHHYQVVFGEQKDLFSPNFFYPAKKMLFGSDSHFSTAVFYFAFRGLGFDMFSAFQAWVVVLFALNFFIALFVLKKFGCNVWFSSFGAFMFAFSMPIAGQTFHIQTLVKFAVPLVIYFYYQWLQFIKIKDFFYLVISFVLLFHSSAYFTFFTILLLFIFTLFYVLMMKRVDWAYVGYAVKNKKTLLYHLAGILFLLLTCWPFLLLYKYGIGDKQPIPALEFLNRLPFGKAYITPVTGSYFWGWYSWQMQKNLVNFVANEFSPGFIIQIVFFTGFFFYLKKHKSILLFSLTGLLFLFVFTRFGDFSMAQYFQKLPVIKFLQSPWRFYLIFLAFFFISVTLIFHHTSQISRLWKWVCIVLSIAIMTENFVIHGTMKHMDLNVAKNAHLKMEDLVKLGRKKIHKAFVILPSTDTTLTFDHILSAMTCANDLNFPTLNGYTTIGPQGYCIDWLNPTREQVNNWLKYKGWKNEEINDNILYVVLPKDL